MKPFLRLRISVFSVFLSFLATLAIASPSSARVLDRSVVTVNNDIILESDIDKFIEKSKSKSFQELFGGIDPKTLTDRDKVLQLLVEEKIINQQVKKLDLQASDQEVEGQIRAILKRNGITENQLKDRLKQLGTSLQDYREGIKRQIERKNLVDREIKPTLEVSEEQLRHFYLRTAKPDEIELQYKIAHIFVDGSKKGAAERAQKIWAEVSKKPDEFEKFVKESSDDSSNLENGGLLGYFTLSQLAKEFRETVPKTPPGNVTKPIKTSSGYHIVKVLEAKNTDFATLPKERKEALRNQMVGSELEKRMGMWLERKKAEASILRPQGKVEKPAPSREDYPTD